MGVPFVLVCYCVTVCSLLLTTSASPLLSQPRPGASVPGTALRKLTPQAWRRDVQSSTVGRTWDQPSTSHDRVD